MAADASEPLVAWSQYAEALTVARETGQRREVAQCLEGLAMLLTDIDTPRAVQVCTSAAALRSTIGAAYWPEEQQRLERWLAAARATLGAATYAEAEARGGATAPEEAVRLVLVANSQ